MSSAGTVRSILFMTEFNQFDKLAGYIQRYLPDVKIAIAHGQMKPLQLEEVIHGFLNKNLMC